tara:strand:- start:5444 stop:6880 length:1437 start_codon:yes stop_codon:yes gene_type:complete
MNEATIIYPHQLFETSPAVSLGRPIYLVEEPLILTHNPIHRQKLIFHKLTMDVYQAELEQAGYQVTRVSVRNDLGEILNRDQIEQIHVVDTTDNYLERKIAQLNIERVWYDSPLFVLTKAEAMHRFVSSRKFMASFYKQLRIDKNILIDDRGEPAGGKWSFDDDNRKKLPRDIDRPTDIEFISNNEVKAAIEWSAEIEGEIYGEAGCWLPYTRSEAEKFLQEFFRLRFHHFGTYEDAMTTKGTRLFHSALSPLINVGLLEPDSVLKTAINYAEDNKIPFNSIEGFVRQILGWREFIRASYEVDGNVMRNQNFFAHTRKLQDSHWSGKTGIMPVDQVINTALKFGYTHHIERLMVMGNFMLLSQIHPDEVYRWFMGMYVDAYDWVMVPNVYGMSQFADGGSFATKPYISGSNYLKKMSDFPKGDWEETWTALYWNFINEHLDFFKSNHRLSMMPRLLEKMTEEKKRTHLSQAKDYLSSD